MAKTNKSSVVPISRTRMPALPGAKIALVALACIVALVGAYWLQYSVLNTDPATGSDDHNKGIAEIAPITSVHINEVMSANGTAWSDEHGHFGDWVEITNSSATDSVDITGWILARETASKNLFVFPKQVLAPGEFVVIFCDGTLQRTPGYTYHAPFKLSSDGETLVLFNDSEKAVEAINIPSLRRNESYAKIDGQWQVVSYYTPGMPNEESYHKAMTEFLDNGSAGSGVVISEIMASNKTYGAGYDYVEIYNGSGSSVNLAGWSLSDSPAKPTKWRFPDVTLGAGQYLLVYCSGLDDAEHLHTNFKLAAEGETVLLSNPQGIAQSVVTYENLGKDRALSLSDGRYTTNLPPTPGMSNTAESAAAIDKQLVSANPYKVYVSEICAGVSRLEDTEGVQGDWVELHNTSTQDVDISGWGLSDNAGRPRKWCFPKGTVIKAGQYLVVSMNDPNSKSSLNTDFSVSLLADACETFILCTADGTVIDRVPLPRQYASVSYGRIDGKNGFFYLAKSTKGQQNNDTGFPLRTLEAEYSVEGGLYDGPVTVTLTAQPGATIRYTTDGSVPVSSSPVYTGPLTVTQTTVLRTRVWRDNEYPSTPGTQTYFVGVHHTMDIISLVVDPQDLWSNDKGLYVMGKHPLATSPYGSINYGANFWMTWEKSANIEYFTTSGERLLSQGCGFKLHGQYSRSELQKAFKLIARSEYDEENRFNAPLFSKRDYTEYQSVVLRSSGSDGDKTRMRDSILTGLAENTCVMYQETELVIVYLNGEYWGQYNLRERINTYSIAQFEGWTDPENIDLVKANSNVMQGSDESYQTMLSWVKKNGVKSDEALARVAEVVDLDNFIDYMCLEIFTGNTDTLNVKRYRNAVSGDGKWRWIYFDLDWAFYTDTDSINRWLNPEGMGNGMRTNNTLYVELMKNATFRARFLKRFGELMGSDFTTQSIIDRMNARIQLLLPEMEQHCNEWQARVTGWRGETQFKILPDDRLAAYKFNLNVWKSELNRMMDYAKSRPTKLMTYMRSEKGRLKLTDQELKLYFSDAVQAIETYKNMH